MSGWPNRVLRSLDIALLTCVLLLPPNVPPLLSPTSAIAMAAGAPADADREPGHVSDESMTADHERVTGDFERINTAKAFFIERTSALRRPHNCSASVPEAYRGVFAPALDPTQQFNETAAAIAREVLGSTTYAKMLRSAVHSCLLEKNGPNCRKHPPLSDPFDPVKLYITFGVNKLVKLDADGTLVVKATIALKWSDAAWSWQTNTTSGWALPENILVPAADLWHPRFLLANCESENCIVEPRNETRVIVDSNGTVLSFIEPLLRASCEMKLQLFPFDVQNCTLEFQLPDHLIVDDSRGDLSDAQNRFVSHVLSDLVLDLNDNRQVVAVVYQSDEWLLADVQTSFKDFEFKLFKKLDGRWIKTDENLELYRSGFMVYLIAKRHIGYYVSNLLVPLLIVVVCGLFTIFLPGHSDARLNLAVTVLLGFIFVQTILASQIPKSDDHPLISQYVMWSMILSMINLAACAVCVGIGELPEDSKPPRGIRLVSLHMGRMLKQRIQRSRLLGARSTESGATVGRQGVQQGPTQPEHELEAFVVTDPSKTSTAAEKEQRTAGGGTAPNEGNMPAKEGPTWGGLLFNLNLLVNASYLFGTVLLFATLLGPLLAALANNKQLVEWSPKSE